MSVYILLLSKNNLEYKKIRKKHTNRIKSCPVSADSFMSSIPITFIVMLSVVPNLEILVVSLELIRFLFLGREVGK